MKRMLSYGDYKELFAIRTTYFGRLVRIMAYPFFLFVEMLGLTPNLLTLCSTTTTALGVLAFYAQNGWGYILGTLLLQLGYIFDCLDGIVARNHNQGSKFGAFFDLTLDRVDNYVIYFGLFIQQLVSGSIRLTVSNLALFFVGASLYFIYVNTSQLKGLILNLEKPSRERYGLLAILSYQLLDNGLFLLLIALSVIIGRYLDFVFWYGLYNLVFTLAIILAGYKNHRMGAGS